ncbi:hypothetical protein [Vibrio owensii]|uniref:Uncharacterized protein n=1 Tax=Vibrio owensii CAIM 1854 = LMG 25443 TaxID=1229493 RepID=A0A0C1ZJM0_9VIBR|nr:hypothetical protein [Vibrio owensii]KIF53361.1 hypothetical protein H735_10595 [Vibrio owensii CAIM 1854 = LMG 25443]
MKECFVSSITGDVFNFTGFEDRVLNGEVGFKIKGVEFNVDATNRNRALNGIRHFILDGFKGTSDIAIELYSHYIRAAIAKISKDLIVEQSFIDECFEGRVAPIDAVNCWLEDEVITSSDQQFHFAIYTVDNGYFDLEVIPINAGSLSLVYRTALSNELEGDLFNIYYDRNCSRLKPVKWSGDLVTSLDALVKGLSEEEIKSMNDITVIKLEDGSFSPINGHRRLKVNLELSGKAKVTNIDTNETITITQGDDGRYVKVESIIN